MAKAQGRGKSGGKTAPFLDFQKPFKCKERGILPEGPINEPDATDVWRPENDGTHTCPFCGSLHWAEITDIMNRYADGEEGYRFDTTSKNYKIYGNRPGTINAGIGGIKFYSWHLPESEEEMDFFRTAERRARAKLAAHLKERYG